MRKVWLPASQSVSQLFHGPAPRSPLHRLAVRHRHSRSSHTCNVKHWEIETAGPFSTLIYYMRYYYRGHQKQPFPTIGVYRLSLFLSLRNTHAHSNTPHPRALARPRPRHTRLRALRQRPAERSTGTTRSLCISFQIVDRLLMWAQIQKCARMPSSRRRCIVASAASTLIDSGTAPQPNSRPSK